MDDTVEAQRLIRCGFNEIIAGYTPLTFRRNELYIKHFGALDQIEVDAVYKNSLARVIDRGVPTSEDKAKQLADDALWTAKDEDDLLTRTKELEGLRQAKGLLFLKSQIDEHQKIIEKQEMEYFGVLVKKNDLFGKTAEFFANKRVSDFCIVHSIFKDRECLSHFFDAQAVDELEDEAMEEVTNCYNEAVKKFEELHIKKIALAPIFQNYYYLAKSVYEFYGRAITSLTFYQIQLATFGDYYKQVLYGQENPPPSEVCSDPIKLEDWITGASRAKKVMEASLGKNTGDEGGISFTSLVGAEQADLDYLGMKDQGPSISLNQKIKEAGGFLNMQQMMALAGNG